MKAATFDVGTTPKPFFFWKYHGICRRAYGLFCSLSGRGTTRAEDAQGTPTQSHISPSILVYEDESRRCSRDTYPGSYITKYTSIRRLNHIMHTSPIEVRGSRLRGQQMPSPRPWKTPPATCGVTTGQP